VFVQTFRFLRDDAIWSGPDGVLTCSVPRELPEFRRQVVDSPAYRAAGRLKLGGTFLGYGPADVCVPARQPGWYPGHVE
jgi:hypothetical protein